MKSLCCRIYIQYGHSITEEDRGSPDLIWENKKFAKGLRKKEDSMDTENGCSQLQPNADVSNVSEQTEIKRPVKQLPLALGTTVDKGMR